MLQILAQFALLALVIIAAGMMLTRFADAIGEITGLGRSLAGLILLAGATSLPELAVDCSAVMIGAIDMAVGTLLGSSLFNLLILAVLDLSLPAKRRMLSAHGAPHALSALASIVLTSIVLIGVATRSPISIGRMGVDTIALAIAYVFMIRLVYLDRLIATAASPEPTIEPASESPPPPQRPMKWWAAFGGYLLATGVIFAAAPRLAETADKLALETGLGGTFVGTTLVAATTSLPEIVTTIAALRLGAVDMAIGNIFGSNAFNMAILSVAELFSPQPLLSIASTTHAVTAGAVILITALAVITLIYRPTKRFFFIEPDALLLATLIIGALWLVYILG